MINEDDYNARLFDAHYAYDTHGSYTQEIDLYSVKDYLTGLMECVYESGETDKLEHCLEELCYLLDVSFSGKELKVQKKDNLLNEWFKGYSQAMIDLQMEDERCGGIL